MFHYLTPSRVTYFLEGRDPLRVIIKNPEWSPIMSILFVHFSKPSETSFEQILTRVDIPLPKNTEDYFNQRDFHYFGYEMVAGYLNPEFLDVDNNPVNNVYTVAHVLRDFLRLFYPAIHEDHHWDQVKNEEDGKEEPDNQEDEGNQLMRVKVEDLKAKLEVRRKRLRMEVPTAAAEEKEEVDDSKQEGNNEGMEEETLKRKKNKWEEVLENKETGDYKMAGSYKVSFD